MTQTEASHNREWLGIGLGGKPPKPPVSEAVKRHMAAPKRVGVFQNSFALFL
jgi:hypothetical protein